MKRWSLLTLAVLAGCTTVGPDYQRPPVSLPAQYAGAEAGPTQLSADWWVLYAEPELQSLVERALNANSSIAQAAARVEFAEAQLREAGGALVPTVNLGANAGRSELGAGVPGNTAGRRVRGNDFQLALSTSFEIDFWGKLRRANEAARALLLSSEAARDTVRLTIAGSVAQSWFALRALDDQIAATRGVLKTRDDSLRLINERVKAGSAAGLDAAQAEILRADAAVQLRELQRQRALAQTTLGALVGEPGLALPEAGLKLNSAVPVPPAGLPSELLERRPDVRAAEQQLVAANAQVGVARAAMFPTVSLTGALGQQSSALSSLLEGPSRFWQLGFGLSLPLFDGGRTKARLDQAGARQREAVGAYQEAVSTAFKEVADALATQTAAREQAQDLDRRDQAAQRALKLAQARYDAGYAGYLELLDAQRTATASQLDVLRNRQAQLGASVDLIRALGGGWTAR